MDQYNRFEGIQLPDYLPSRYRSWLDFYGEIVRTFKEKNIEINDETTINLVDHGYDIQYLIDQYTSDKIYFYHAFPLILIKARAFDQIVDKIPPPQLIDKINYMSVLSGPRREEDVLNALSDLMTISRHLHRR